MMPPLVLLHGFPFDASLWDEVRAALPPATQVLTPNLPGFGGTPALYPVSMVALADWLADWLTARGITRATVVGHSLGGYVALALAVRAPQLLAGLGLVHSTTAADTPDKQRSRDEQIAFLERHSPAKLVPNLIRPLAAEMNAERLRSRLEQYVEQAAQLPASFLQAIIAALRDRPAQQTLLSSFNRPTLFLAGRQDPMLNLEAARQQATQAPTALAVFLDQCGHLAMLEHPAAVAAALNHLLASVKQVD